MKISKKVREEAAILCSATATQWATFGDGDATTWTSAMLLGIGKKAQDLANEAWAVSDYNHHHEHENDVYIASRYAEADALIRTGWCPGDEP